MIFFECYADESLLRSIGVVSRRLSGGHSFGRSNVMKRLSKAGNSIGLIDEDPGSTRDGYLESLLSGKPDYADKYIIYTTDPKNSNKLVVIKPDLEGLILNIAEDLKKNLKNYGLGSTKRELSDQLKIQKNKRHNEKLIGFLQDAGNHPTIIKLKEIFRH